MSFQTVCLYPNGDDLQFNISYYLNNHLPLVQEKFGPLGLERVEITRFDANEDGSEPLYILQAILNWKSQESMRKAMSSPDVGTVFRDLSNFCNKQPVAMSGTSKIVN